jgi:hypothetical protein
MSGWGRLRRRLRAHATSGYPPKLTVKAGVVERHGDRWPCQQRANKSKAAGSSNTRVSDASISSSTAKRSRCAAASRPSSDAGLQFVTDGGRRSTSIQLGGLRLQGSCSRARNMDIYLPAEGNRHDRNRFNEVLDSLLPPGPISSPLRRRGGRMPLRTPRARAPAGPD